MDHRDKYFKYRIKMSLIRGKRGMYGGNSGRDISNSEKENTSCNVSFHNDGGKFYMVLVGEINDHASMKLKMFSLEIQERVKKKRVKNPEFIIHICSGGGSVFSGLSMYNTIMDMNKSGVSTCSVSDGLVGSSATYPYLACDKRKSHENDRFLFHLPTTNQYGKFKADELKEDMKNMDGILDSMKSIYLKRTKGKMGTSVIRNQMKNELWVSAEQCRKWGVVNHV